MSVCLFGQLFQDDRLAANLLAILGVMLVLVLAAALLRWLLTHTSKRLTRWTGVEKLEALGQHATRHGHNLLFWLTVAGVVLTAVGGTVYHALGWHVLRHLESWLAHCTAVDLLHFGLAAGGLVVLGLSTWAVLRVVRRLLPLIESHVTAQVARKGNQERIRHWFVLFEGCTLAVVRLLALLAAFHLVGLGRLGDRTIGFVLRMLTILGVARLLTVACKALSHTLADHGTRRFKDTAFRRYWERITRLFPFGERCFEAAVYVTAASLCVRELHFIAFVADFGPLVVECIGIFFCTRVVIELLHVLLHEAFGLYAQGHQLDQKGRTLVPLIHSMSQYVIYFGSVVLMLGVLGVDTRPILAGAGILGLAVGLGAQSLVTDVVSGFFIVFENQFLVGDYVKIGEAAGTVEELGIRVTKIRDGHGKLHIIPNGQIKGVVSYSAGYVCAVVDYAEPAAGDVEKVFQAMREAGERLRKERSEVLGETEIHGIVDFKGAEMTVRAVTRVQPGTHGIIQNEYRRMLKQVFEEAAAPGVRLAA